MNAQKRGLGRGLEALLVDVSSKKTPATASVKTIQTENANLLKEAEVLKALLDDFETLVSNLNIDKPTL
jgi:hypothetical protein